MRRGVDVSLYPCLCEICGTVDKLD